MLKVITLVCALAGTLAAIILEFWLRSRRGRGEDAVRTLALLNGRNVNFRRFQYLSVTIAAVLITAAIGVGIDWISAAVYFAGALLTSCVLFFSAGTGVSGASSAIYAAADGDVRTSLKCAYRSGAVMGLSASAACMFMLGAMFFFLDTASVISHIPQLALGAATVTVFTSVSGRVYSSAYEHAASDRDFTDGTGSFYGAGADLMESLFIAAAAAVMLAEAGVDNSGVGSTFTSDASSRYPLMLYAAGTAASIIGVMVYRGTSRNDPARGSTSGCITAGIITAAITLWSSVKMLESRVYMWPAAAGIAAGIILGELSKRFSSDSKLFVKGHKTDRKLGTDMMVITALSRGMISLVFSTAVLSVAVIVSYNFAGIYGIAICAAGLASITGTSAAISGLGIISHEAWQTSSLDVLDNAHSRASVSARSYLALTSTLSAAAMLLAFTYTAQKTTINLMGPFVLAGLIAGVAYTMIMLGAVGLSVRTTAHVILAGREHRGDKTGMSESLRGSVVPPVLAMAGPAVTGLLFGVDALTGFLTGAVAAAFILLETTSHSGEHFENTATESLASLVKMMLIFSAAFLSVFSRVGGFLF